MGAIQASQHRHGMPGSPIQSVEDHIERLVDLPLLMLKREGRNEVGVGRFSEHLNTLDATEQALAFSDFLHHEHYVWHSARPRSAHATLELRAACQQPPREHMAAAALGVAMVQAAPQLAQLVAERLGSDPWAVMRSWHPAVIDEGLAVTEPVPGLLADVLSCCYAALRARGRGEQRFLDPLGARLDARINPAQASHAAFEAGGLHALLDAVRCT